jgi:hypothetical protein
MGRFKAQGYEKNVFINCPLDTEYQPLIRPLLFTILRLGFFPRLHKIFGLIGNSRFGIHDLSRCVATKKGEIYRLNMPFELGLDFSAKHLARKNHNKKILVLEEQRHRYAKALSDIAGSDIKEHSNNPKQMVQQVRDWFVETSQPKRAPTAQTIWYEFNECMNEISIKRQSEKVPKKEAFNIPVNELLMFFRAFLKTAGLQKSEIGKKA